jgi:hypothetical protein
MEHYTKGEVLGKGTFGVVVRATHKLVKVVMNTHACVPCNQHDALV